MASPSPGGAAEPWLNYHHLLYFWTVVREGGVSKAAERLRLSQPTVSAQIRKLESALGERLLERRGRGLVLTEAGRVVYRYAEDIFPVGRELVDTLRGRAERAAPRLTIGIANAVPKLVVHRLLEPAMAPPDRPYLECLEDNTEQLVARLAAYELDAVIADRPSPPHLRVRVFNHLLGESGITFFAAPALAARLRRRFPRSLDGAPMLLPARTTALRQSLDAWLERQRVRPVPIADFEDSALMKAFGSAMAAVFPAPTAIAGDVRRLYGVAALGQTREVRDAFYVISAERRLTHPAVRAITDGGRRRLLAPVGRR